MFSPHSKTQSAARLVGEAGIFQDDWMKTFIRWEEAEWRWYIWSSSGNVLRKFYLAAHGADMMIEILDTLFTERISYFNMITPKYLIFQPPGVQTIKQRTLFVDHIFVHPFWVLNFGFEFSSPHFWIFFFVHNFRAIFLAQIFGSKFFSSNSWVHSSENTILDPPIWVQIFGSKIFNSLSWAKILAQLFWTYNFESTFLKPHF